MSERRIYLDYNATAPLRAVARRAMLEALDRLGNASSVHREGRQARSLLETARADVASHFGVGAANILFVSGATEAANCLLNPALRDGTGGFQRLVIGASEHACVLSGHRFAPEQTQIANVLPDGRIDLADLDRQLAGPGRAMVALQSANNETGVIQPVAEAAQIVHARGGLLVCDAVQSAGRDSVDGAELGADAVFVSSHKLGGPAGVGAIALVKDGLHMADPLLRGGGQESGRRAGTENVAGIVGFAAAFGEAAGARGEAMARLRMARDRLEKNLLAALPELAIFGVGAVRLANTSAFAVPGISAETLLIALDLAGFAVSSGSACSSGKVQASHVLATMGVKPHIATGALRVSLGWNSAGEDVDAFCETFAETIRTIRRRRVTP